MTTFESKTLFFYHPVKVIFIDDNSAFIDSLKLEFGTKINMISFTNPKIALQIIQNSIKEIKFISKKTNEFNPETTIDQVVDLEFNDILNFIYDKTRFDHTAVLVVDYQMPEMDGIKFCQKLKDKNIFKIMLTAEADKDIVIMAFNEGLIDKFILKTNKNLHQELQDAIDTLNNRSFIDLSRILIKNNGDTVKFLLKNELYLKLFNEVFIQSKAIEYYLVDQLGSILFLDKYASPTWLIMRQSKELDEQLKLLEGYDISDSIISSLQKREKILFLFSEHEYKKSTSEWADYLFDAKELDDDLYYSVVNARVTDYIQWEKIVPYAEIISKAEEKSDLVS